MASSLCPGAPPRPSSRGSLATIVSGTDRAFDFMAKHGIKGVILGTAEQYVEPWMHRYQEANARYGRELELGENLALGLWYYIDASYDKAKKALQPLFEEHVKFAAPLGMLRYTEQQMQATGPAGVATHIAAGTDFDDVLNKRAWFCGTPADTIAYLQKIQEKYPDLEQILIAFPMGSAQAQFKDQLTCLSEEVMPAFQTGKVTA